MPRIIEKTVFKYSELSESAQKKAREWMADCVSQDFPWNSESKQSIKVFADYFGIPVNYSFAPYESIDFTEIEENEAFRGIKLKQFEPDYMPTGDCLDCALWETFHKEFKRTCDAKQAFNAAVYAALKEWKEDMEYQLSESSIVENIEINDYEFSEDGSIA